MKLLVVLSVVLAYGYAEKLDRTYLPPAGAATAGGNAEVLIAPSQSVTGFEKDISTSGSQTGGSTITQSISQEFTESQGSNDLIPTNVASNNGVIITSTGASSGVGGLVQTGFVSSQIGAQDVNGQIVGNFNQGFGLGSGQNVFVTYPERAQAAAERSAEILRYINENNVHNYRYGYGTSNGISADEAGEALNGVNAEGAFSYTGDDGKFYSITYTADKNGFRPQGDHLPTPPPIPEDILKSLEVNAKALAAGTQEGAYRPDLYADGVYQHQHQHSTASSGLNFPIGSLGFVQDVQINQGQSGQGYTQTDFGTNQASYQVSGGQQFGSVGSQNQYDNNQSFGNKITQSTSQTQSITGANVQVVSSGQTGSQGSEEFSVTRQPPSYTAQEGYKY